MKLSRLRKRIQLPFSVFVALATTVALVEATPTFINPNAHGVRVANTAAENDAAIARMFNLIPSGSTIVFPPGTYRFSRISHPAKRLKIVLV